MGNTWSLIYPPKPRFTENELPNLAGKVGSCFISALMRHRLTSSI